VADQSRFRDKVESAMTAKLETIGIDQPMERLLPIFDEGRVAIVMEGGRFHGLITRIDMLNHLRRMLK
jgi:cystathionine beta-synthase